MSATLVTLAGCFALLWLAPAVQEEDEASVSRVRRTRRWFAGVLEHDAGSRPAYILCAGIGAALAAFVAWQLGAFGPVRVFGVYDTFASFDHPFHVARAETLLRSVLGGESLRWIANHQGGYPAEFYPFGFAWIEVILWSVGLGQLAMPLVHKLAVIGLFLAPGLAFFAMSRRDGWPPTVALAAFGFHIAIPGGMWHGGYSELVYVGLVANVAASLGVVVATVAAADAFSSGTRRAVGLAAVSAAAAIWCNPRSAIALVVCVGSAWLVAALSLKTRGIAARVTLRLGVVAFLAALLAAPELASLLRFRELYYFVRFTSYASSLEYLTASIDAVSLPGFALAIIGVAAAGVASGRRYITRTTAVSLIAYGVATLLFSFGTPALVQQLEATRLMPVQRLLTLYLAGVGLHAMASAAGARLNRMRWVPTAEGLVTVATLLVFLGPWQLLGPWSRGLYKVQRSSVPQMAIFQNAITIADRTAPPNTSILVVGSAVSTHQQLWAPVRSERLFFYDYWMWYWQTRHAGPYDARHATRYDADRLEEIFDRQYLDRHAIGAIVLTPDAQSVAERSPHLQRHFGGDYGLFTVKTPTPVITFGGARPEGVRVTNHRIEATGTSDGADAVIRRNWFPRWRAAVNGKPVPVTHTEDGYMRVALPAGAVRLVLTYALDWYDKAARAAALGATVIAGILLFGSVPPATPEGSRRGGPGESHTGVVGR